MSNNQKLLVVVTNKNGDPIFDKVIDGDINDRSAIDRFARELSKNQGYTFIDGSWNDDNQFIGIVDTPFGNAIVAVKEAD